MRLVSAFAFPETASFTSLRIDRIALADRTGPVSLADGNPLVERLFENRAQIALSPRSAAAAGMTRLEPGLLWGPAVANNILGCSVRRLGAVGGLGLLHHELLPERTSGAVAPAADGMTRVLAMSSKLRPLSAQMASFFEKVCQRLIATSTKRGSISSMKARRPTRSAARRVVPDPPKRSSTMSPRRLQSLIAAATSATGLTVGCDCTSSMRPARNVLIPA